MTSPRLFEDIRNQPESLAHVFEHQLGEGRSALLEAARLLRKARRVVITGMRASLYASLPLEYQLVAALQSKLLR